MKTDEFSVRWNNGVTLSVTSVCSQYSQKAQLTWHKNQYTKLFDLSVLPLCFLPKGNQALKNTFSPGLVSTLSEREQKKNVKIKVRACKCWQEKVQYNFTKYVYINVLWRLVTQFSLNICCFKCCEDLKDPHLMHLYMYQGPWVRNSVFMLIHWLLSSLENWPNPNAAPLLDGAPRGPYSPQENH